ncbi:MAG: hypothetical protein ACO3C1_07140 [Ilumatobacteraceae bacterium]
MARVVSLAFAREDVAALGLAVVDFDVCARDDERAAGVDESFRRVDAGEEAP